ncbi:hypothetical protein [Halovenus marina]|uniref:hypothetical protein n=1 Tax=Halovenus marina TaxID=3396621 RepID=UPI003F56D74B
MSDNDQPRSITDLAHQRNGDGELLPVTETTEVHGETVELKVIPPTTGQQNEWRERLADDDGAELAEDLVLDLLEEFAGYEPSDFQGAESYEDLRPAITDAYTGVILAKIFDAEDTDEFVDKLNEAAKDVAQGNGEEGTETAQPSAETVETAADTAAQAE